MSDSQHNLLPILLAITALGALTFIAVTMTSFIKLSTILFILRNALGLQQTPPNIVLYGIALLLSAFVMAPTMAKVYSEATQPEQRYETANDFRELAGKVQVPIREFMLRFTSEGEREFFTQATQRVWGPDSGLSANPTDLIIVLPAFVISELRSAFKAGFLIYLPFIAIDLVTTAILMAMGMSAVSPTTISVPFKLFLFVGIEGWTRLIHSLIIGYSL